MRRQMMTQKRKKVMTDLLWGTNDLGSYVTSGYNVYVDEWSQAPLPGATVEFIRFRKAPVPMTGIYLFAANQQALNATFYYHNAYVVTNSIGPLDFDSQEEQIVEVPGWTSPNASLVEGMSHMEDSHLRLGIYSPDTSYVFGLHSWAGGVRGYDASTGGAGDPVSEPLPSTFYVISDSYPGGGGQYGALLGGRLAIQAWGGA